MKSCISYKIIPEKKLVLEYFCGNLVWDDLINNKKKLALEKNYNPTFNIIDDVRDAFVVYKEENIVEFVELLRNNSELYGIRKTAILTDTPNQLINSITLDTVKNTPFKLKTVSTLLTATKWVNASPSDFKLVKDSLTELKNKAQSL
ncbi:MAG: hypothetical protein GQ540_10595 [Lutibacter sp.]|uniref:hypothetical protein n=1 Tax=Lutibacter sp. TaxID=1925666 RepID=UPI001A0A5D38|nr:hypothetical protein [Lutibacter sp.]NOR28961.1 hypothetical protein [Lutibacter sp.]